MTIQSRTHQGEFDAARCDECPLNPTLPRRSWAEVAEAWHDKSGERLTDANLRMIGAKALRKLRAGMAGGVQ